MRIHVLLAHIRVAQGVAVGTEHGHAGDVAKHRGVQIHGDVAAGHAGGRIQKNLKLRPGSRGRGFAGDGYRQWRTGRAAGPKHARKCEEKGPP